MKITREKPVKMIVLGIALIAGAFVLTRNVLSSKSNNNTSQVQGIENQDAPAKASAEVNKTFDFKAINQKQVKKDVKFIVASVDRKDLIRVKGEEQVAPKGKDFLLVRIEIENSTTERLALSPSDLVRIEDENGKLFAPDYHNGSVILEPLSVKRELLSFVVNKDSKKFVFQIGELEGNKEKVEVSF